MIDIASDRDRLDETFRGVPDRHLLPEALHPLVDDYEHWTDVAEEEQYTVTQSDHLIQRAEAADLAEAEQATDAGEPIAGTPHRDQAEATIRQAELSFRVAQSKQRKAALALLLGLREHESEIAANIRASVSAIANEYREKLTQLKEQSERIAEKLEVDSAAISFIEQIRAGERKDIDYSLVAVPRPSTGEALDFTAALTNRLEALAQPAVSAYVHVVGGNGKVTRMARGQTIDSMIDTGHLRLATPEEVTAADPLAG